MDTIIDIAIDIANLSKEGLIISEINEDDTNYYCNITDGHAATVLTFKKSMTYANKEGVVRRAISSAMSAEYLKMGNSEKAKFWLKWENAADYPSRHSKGIMAKAAPYGEIYKLPGLLDTFASRYVAMFEEMEEPVQAAIVEARKRVFDELEGKQCHDSLSGKFAAQWNELREKADTCNNVATLQNIKVEADALKIRHLNEIGETEAKLQSQVE